MNAFPLPLAAAGYTGAPEELSEWLRAHASYLEAWEGETPTVLTVRRIALELDAAFRRGATRSVGLAEAAEIGGYSVSHLGRLLRAQPGRNVGTKHRPAFAYCDVPRKAGYQSPRNDEDEVGAKPSPHPAFMPMSVSRSEIGRAEAGSRLLAAKAGRVRRRPGG